MKLLITSLLLATMCSANPTAMQDSKTKSYNSVQSSTKQESPTYQQQVLYQTASPKQQDAYQQLLYQTTPRMQEQIIYQPQYVPVQRTVPAMIVIMAHPTAPYCAPVQQLLNYFHTNPQARQQLLYGYQPQATVGSYVVAAPPPYYHAQQYYPTPAVPAQQYSAPSAVSAQQYSTQQYSAPESVAPVQLNQIAEVAQLTAQKLYGGQIKSVPPIITGLENFTPEQQAAIKAQLGNVIAQDQQDQGQVQYGQQQQQYTHQQQQYSQQQQKQNEFVPSPEIKAEEGAKYGRSMGEVYGKKTYSTKG